MAATVSTTANFGTINSGVTGFNVIGPHQAGQSATEANHQKTARTGGSFSYLSAYASSNSLSGTMIFRFRNNTGGGSANGNQIITFNAADTLWKSDTSNTDSVSAGNIYNASVTTAAGSGSAVVNTMGMVFSATTNTTRSVGCVRNNGRNFSADSTTNPQGFGAGLDAGLTEANQQTAILVTSTLTNLYARASANARTTNTTINSRIGGSNGNLLITYGNVETGIKEDTSNSDTLSATNLVNFALITSTGGNNITMTAMTADLNTTTSQTHLTCGNAGGAANTTTFEQMAGAAQGGNTTEANFQQIVGYSTTISNMTWNALANTIVGNSVLRTRINTGGGSANGNQNLTWGTAETGSKSDNSNTDVLSATNIINTSFAMGAAGTTISGNYISIVSTVASASTTVKQLAALGVG